jgi:capsular exopolysaccharide synthesis family protein
MLDKDSNIIAITSCAPGEGKSTIVANLAISLAQSGKKVLLVDCDLRKPTIHKKFGISNASGLTSLLLKESTLEEAIYKVDIPNLGLIPSGPVPPNPSEILGSKKMGKILEDLKNYFDVILLDSPPVLVVSDLHVLASTLDGILLVATYGVTEKNAILRAKESIIKVGGKVLGVVENKIPQDAKGYGYSGYGYGKYQGYYSSDTEE